MSFNTALSGIRAANADLSVTGNNIANAGTIGFKSSRAEFADVYSASILGTAGNTPGSGVSLEMIRQNFDNGNRKITERDLDMAVNGAGFFVMNKDGDQLFTRAGSFSLDKEGYVISSPGTYLQGFSANAAGNIGGILGNLRIDVTTQAPRQTTLVTAAYNLNSNAPILETVGTQFTTNSGAIGLALDGLLEAQTTALDGGNIAAGSYTFSPTNSLSFDLVYNGPSTAGLSQSVTITLDSGFASDAQSLANLINSEIYSSPTPLNVEVVVDGDQLVFRDLSEGVVSTIAVDSVADNGSPAAVLAAINVAAGNTSVAGVPAVTNGYGSQTLEIRRPDGATFTYTSAPGSSAAKTASELNAIAGISASARTTAVIRGGDGDNGQPRFVNDATHGLTLNNQVLLSTNLADLANEINALSTSALPGITATYNETTGNLDIVSAVGTDLRFSFDQDLANPGSLQVIGRSGTAVAPQPTPPLTVDDGYPFSLTDAVVVGGSIDVLMDEGFSIVSSSAGAGGIFAPFSPASFTPVPINSFDPTNQDTYNHATSLPIYDSLGNPHVMSQYFVKQPYDPADASTSPNHWVMYVQIDGENVGDPDPTLPPPANSVPGMASFNLHFGPDGTMNQAISDKMLVSNWRPRNEDGELIGALGPLNVLQGGTLPVVEPATSSNFEIDLSGTTQFGNVFAVEDRDQNGYSTGRLSGLDVGADGIIFARFTNGEAQVLGQVALANFNNVDALKPVGNTMWAQTFETGEAIIGAPGSASLGAVSAGTLEESNVDLSEQLVNLIIAQRNFQANAKTIETANATTQTIINLR